MNTVEEMVCPWLTEPNREEFEHCGLKCLILRNESLGPLCGYVGLPESHPWFGVERHQCLLGCKSEDCTWKKHHPAPGNIIDVHGGLTFSELGSGEVRQQGLWWFGFDCAHYNDYCPGMAEVLKRVNSSYDMGVYRDIDYVRNEVKHMAEQMYKYRKSGWFWSRYWRLHWHWLAFKDDYLWKGWRFWRDLEAWFAYLVRRLDKVWHFLRYQISCSNEEWDTRHAVIARLRENSYAVREAPNPCRLTAEKEEEEFIIDISGKEVYILPIKWVYGHTDKPILVTDIPSSGRYGIRNEESKYYDEIRHLV